jgi:NTP pyrophosphohydrolases including oxidative damage repair enzymes
MKQKKKTRIIQNSLPPRPKSLKGFRIQYAALPYRIMPDENIDILLITSRETHRWVLPKGWPMENKLPCQTAQTEAYEEAGIIGQITCEPVGFYTYPKILEEQKYVWCHVAVFPLLVAQQCVIWPEKEERESNWFSPEEAAKCVHEQELADLLRSFPAASIFTDQDDNRSLKHAQRLFS